MVSFNGIKYLFNYQNLRSHEKHHSFHATPLSSCSIDIDRSNRVEELNEENNEFTESFNVLGASCSDTDGGSDEFVRGMISYSTSSSSGQRSDRCLDENNVLEFSCIADNSGEFISEPINCPDDHVCKYGQCQRDISNIVILEHRCFKVTSLNVVLSMLH